MSAKDEKTPPGRGRERRVTIALAAVAFFVILGGVLAFEILKAAPEPPPAAIAGDPLLLQGRELFLSRCVSCHGPKGRGDGVIAKGLAGPPVGNLTDANWKHGDRPEQVLEVVEEGVKNTAMPGWGRTFSPEDVRAVSAYVYFLAGRTVPEALRR